MGVLDHHPSHEAPIQTTPLLPNEPVATIPPVPTSPKHNFRRGTTKTQTQFLPDWNESDLARMSPEAREVYERFILSDRPKYIPKKPEQVAKLSAEDRQEYENSLKITKTPKRYSLRSRPY
jgi:hypothetical protein